MISVIVGILIGMACQQGVYWLFRFMLWEVDALIANAWSLVIGAIMSLGIVAGLVDRGLLS